MLAPGGVLVLSVPYLNGVRRLAAPWLDAGGAADAGGRRPVLSVRVHAGRAARLPRDRGLQVRSLSSVRSRAHPRGALRRVRRPAAAATAPAGAAGRAGEPAATNVRGPRRRCAGLAPGRPLLAAGAAPARPHDARRRGQAGGALAVAILGAMTESEYRIEDLGDRRVLTVGGQDHSTGYSERVIRMLIERKGASRARALLPVQGDARPTLPRAAVRVSPRARRPRPARARGRLLLRPHDRVPRRAAGGRAHRHVRHRRRLRGDRAREGRGGGARKRSREVRLLDNDETRRLP